MHHRHPWTLFNGKIHAEYVKISDIHGRSSWVNSRLIVPMYHPAAALHQPSLKSVLIQDFKGLPAAIEQARKGGHKKIEEDVPPTQGQPPEETSEQLSLF